SWRTCGPVGCATSTRWSWRPSSGCRTGTCGSCSTPRRIAGERTNERMPPVIVRPDELDFAEFVRPGDTVVWGQTCAEPVTLTEELMRQRHQVAPIRCFVGIPVTRTLPPECADAISCASYCGSGTNRRMPRAGAAGGARVPYSTLPALLTEGSLRADVVRGQASAPGEQGRYSLGIGDDYYSAASDTACVVIAEVNDQVPQT